MKLSILTSSSNEERKEIAAVIQHDLDRIGLEVTVVPLEFRSMVQRITDSYEYEAALLALGSGDVDPNSSAATITSTGPNHLWRLSGSAPSWQVEIDRLMRQQRTVIDRQERKRLYDRVQELVAENLPLIPLVSPNILAGAARDLGNFRPAILNHLTLWTADELYWRSDPEP